MANIIIIQGNLGADCEQVTSQNGNSFWKINVATKESYKDKEGQRVDRTTWHTCLLYGNYEKLAPYLRSGQSVHVNGTQRHDLYEIKDASGNVICYPGTSNPIKKSYSYIKVDRIELTGGAKPQQQQQPQQQQPQQQTQPQPQQQQQQWQEPTSNDLPF